MLISCRNILTRRIITIATEDLNVVLANCDNITSSGAPELDSFKFKNDEILFHSFLYILLFAE